MNPKLVIVEEFIQVEEECDSIVINYDGVSFKYHILNENLNTMKYDEKSSGEVLGLIIPPMIKYCVGLDISFDLGGSSKIYNKTEHRQILSMSMVFPRCVCEVVYNDDVDTINFANHFEENIRLSFQKI